MGSSPPVQTALADDGILTLTLNRPEKRNAIDAPTLEALAAALQTGARAIVLTGAGGAFCAGADLGSLGERSSEALSDLVDAVATQPRPVVAFIDGVATGVGLALALACDWRVASPNARVLWREGRLSMVPTHGGVARLVQLVGLARAKEALLGGEDLDAEGAYRLGLVSELGDLACAYARVEKMLARAPLSYAAVKRLAQTAADSDLPVAIAAERAAQDELLATHDHREGLAAAREKRDPVFTGR